MQNRPLRELSALYWRDSTKKRLESMSGLFDRNYGFVHLGKYYHPFRGGIETHVQFDSFGSGCVGSRRHRRLHQSSGRRWARRLGKPFRKNIDLR